jgi:hypothetical protein
MTVASDMSHRAARSFTRIFLTSCGFSNMNSAIFFNAGLNDGNNPLILGSIFLLDGMVCSEYRVMMPDRTCYKNIFYFLSIVKNFILPS